MKRFFKQCGSHRRNLALLAASVLAEPQKTAVENHLAACADCRSHFHELKAVIAPLANWEDHFARIQPDPAVQQHWARAIQTAARPAQGRRLTPATAFRDWWQDVIWSSRRIWAGLAAVWLVLLAVNFSGRDHSPALVQKSSLPPAEMIMAWRQQASLLAELLGSSGSGEADRQKTFIPKPRTERMEILTT